MPLAPPNMTPQQFAQDRFCQVKAMLTIDPSYSALFFDGLSLSSKGVELRVRVDEATKQIEVRKE